MLALLLKEVRSFLSSLIGYIVISVFLLLMGLFLWVFNTPFNILEAGFADLDHLFSLAPIVFLFLIPAVTMRSFAEEKRTGTIELLLTRPLTDLQIILAKYFAGLLLVIFSLLPTLLYYLTIHNLGDPAGNVDTGGMWGSYLGLLMLSAAFVSIGVFASAISQNQIVSFIVGVFLCFFFYIGFDFMGSYSLFGGMDGFVRNLGIYEHYLSISRGVVDSRDVIYFISIIVFFVLFTKLVLESRKKIMRLQFVISTSIILMVNIIMSVTFFRIDLTKEKRHSLSETTIKYLKEIEDVITFQIYLTGELPADLKRIEREIREKLDEMKAYAGNNIQYEFFDPNSIEKKEDQMAFMDELSRVRKMRYTILELEDNGTVTQKFIFPGATVSYGNDQQISFNFFVKPMVHQQEDLARLADAAVGNIEYQLMDAMRKVTRITKPRIGILEGHGEADEHELAIITNALSDYYAVERVRIDNKINALLGFNGLIIVQPDSFFSEKDKYVIDQFIMKGGKTAWFIDPLYVPEDTLFFRGQTFGITKDLNLEDQLFTYGARINNLLVLDKNAAPIAIPGYPGQYHEWFFYPLILPERNNPITQNLDPVRTNYTGSIDLVGNDANMRKTILLRSSENSTVYNAPARINYGIIEIEKDVFRNKKPGQVIAVMLEGEFNSVYTDRLAPEFLNNKDIDFRSKSKKNSMLIVADGNIPMNDVEYQDVNGEKRPQYRKLHVDKYHVTNPDGTPRFLYGNKEFVLNAIDYLMGDAELIEIRQRTIMIRRLNTDRIVSERRFWQTINVGLPVALIILFGIGQNYLRKRKYSR